MARLRVLAEGQTEETFVNDVLAPHLYGKGYLSVTAKLMGNSRNRNHRGGIQNWPSIRDEILKDLKNDKSLYVSVMVDYYALPGSDNQVKAWPGRSDANNLPLDEKAPHIEDCLKAEIAEALEGDRGNKRFFPYVMMHEFEALLFSDCQGFAEGMGRADLYRELQAIRDQFPSPEAINDSPQTHPSKRVELLMPTYKKPLHGNEAVLNIGLVTIRKECPGFHRWLEQLDALVG
jgi:Domain of unknown function (DUF4276)